MAKIPVSTDGTKFDQLGDLKQYVNKLGLNTKLQADPVFSLDSQRERLNSFSNIDTSEFTPEDIGTDISLYSNDTQAQGLLEEARAQNQSTTEQLFKGLGRIATTVGTEIGKVPGYMVGMQAAIASETLDPVLGRETNSMEMIVDNAWVNAFEKLDEGIKSTMPVYLTKDVQEGDIMRKLGSSAWWSTTGADGIGFLLSMYGPGLATKSLGVGKMIAKGLEAAGQSSKVLGKVLTAGNILTKGELGAISASSKLIGNAESTVAVAMNTFIESSAEAANTFDNVKQQYMAANPGATEEEAKEIAGTAAANVFKTNMALLAISNVFDEITLFKGFNQTADKVASQSVLGKLFRNGKLDLDAAKKVNIKDAIGNSLKTMGKSATKEGLFEEGFQHEIQTHYEDVSLGKTKAGFMEDVVYNYFEDLMSDPAMQESVVLGSILGSTASLIGNAVQHKREQEILFGRQQGKYPSFMGRFFNQKQKDAQPGLANILQDNFINSFRTISDVAKTDDQGNMIMENGKPVIDETKLQQAIEQKEKLVTLNQLHNIAILEGDKVSEEMYGNMLSFNYFLPFLQQEGGYEVLKEHITEQMTDLMVKKSEEAGIIVSDDQKEKTKKILLDKAKRYNDMYQETKTTNNTELSVSRNSENKEYYDSWKSDVFNRRMQSLIQHDTVSTTLGELNGKFAMYLDENGNAKKLTPEELDNMSPVDIIKYEMFRNQKQQLEEAKKKAKDTYLDLTSRKGLKSDYEKFNKQQQEQAEQLAQTQQQVDQQTVAAAEKMMSQDDFLNSVVDAGYPVVKSKDIKGEYIKDEKIVVEDKDGKRYTLQSVYDGTNKRVDHILIDKNGNITKVTDSNGDFTESFLKRGFKPISKTQISAERKALAIREHKRAQLKLLDEIVNHKTSEITNSKKEIDDIDNQIKAYEEEYKKQKEQIDKYYLKNISGKPSPSKQTLGRLRNMKKLLTELDKTIDNLKARRNFLESRVAKLNLFIDQYTAFKESVQDLEQFSINQESNKTNQQILNLINNIKKDLVLEDDIVKVEEQINKANELIFEYNTKIAQLEKIRDSIISVIKSHEALMQMIMTNKKQLKEVAQKFIDEFTNIGVVLPYNMQKIVDIIANNPHEVLAGETLTKNNIITNAQSIVEQANDNNNVNLKQLFNVAPNDELTGDNVFDFIKNMFKPYLVSESQVQSQHGYSAEDMYSLAENLLMTKNEIATLKKAMDAEQSTVPLLELQKKYIMLNELMLDKVGNRFQQIKKEQELANIDNTQKQPFAAEAEPVAQTDTSIKSQSGRLTPTEYSTTGRNTATTSKEDELDENGYPTLNANEFQRVWFKTIDKIGSDITKFRLIPVFATYDDATTDEMQKQINANNPDPANRSDNDIFVFLADEKNNLVRVDKQGNFIKDGTFVMTSLRKSDEIFGDELKVIPDNILNNYLSDLSLTDRIDFNKAKTEKKTINDVIKSKAGKEKFKDILDNSVEDLLNRAIANAKFKYDAFIKSLVKANKNNTKVYLPIESMTNGFGLYQIKNGKRVKSKPLSVLPELVLSKELGVKQLQGGKLGLVINQKVKIGDKYVDMSPGTVYLQMDDGSTITLDSRTINKDEANVVMYLLSLANGNTPLNTINVPFPSKKNGEKYYYFFNGKKMEGVIPVFYRKIKDNTDTFSLLHSLINYGAKGKDKIKKGEIYVQSGNVVYTNFNNETRQVPLTEIAAAVAEDKTGSYNDAVAELYSFLLEKRFNVNKVLLGNNPIFMYPKLRKGKQGYELEFDTNNTYYSYLLNNVLTTTVAAPTESHPRRLQRNVVYKPEAVKTTEPSATTAKPTSQVAQPKVTPKTPVNTAEPLANISQPQPQGSIDVKTPFLNKINAAIEKMLAADPSADVYARMLKAKDPTIENEVNVSYAILLQNGNGTAIYSEEQLRGWYTEVFDSILDKYKIETPTPVAEPTVVKEIVEETPVVETPVATTGPISVRDLMRQKAQQTEPTNIRKTPTIGKKSADKVADTEALLESLVNKGVIEKKCK